MSAQNESAIKLTWAKVTSATDYRIYYRTSTKNSWKTAVSATAKTTQTFTGLNPNKAFRFAVRTYIKTTSGSVWGSYTTIIASTTPLTPTVKAVSNAGGKITMTWSKVSGATGYEIYYKLNNGSWKLYKTVTKPVIYNFSGLRSGAKYTFAVRAYRTVGGQTFRSSYKAVSVTVK